MAIRLMQRPAKTTPGTERSLSRCPPSRSLSPFLPLPSAQLSRCAPLAALSPPRIASPPPPPPPGGQGVTHSGDDSTGASSGWGRLGGQWQPSSLRLATAGHTPGLLGGLGAPPLALSSQARRLLPGVRRKKRPNVQVPPFVLPAVQTKNQEKPYFSRRQSKSCRSCLPPALLWTTRPRSHTGIGSDHRCHEPLCAPPVCHRAGAHRRAHHEDRGAQDLLHW